MSVCVNFLHLPICTGSERGPGRSCPLSKYSQTRDGIVFFEISEEPSAGDDNETLYFPSSGHLRDSQTAG